MKKFKISIVAVVALVLGIAGSAFTTQHSVKNTAHPTATAWFKYMGDPGNLSQLHDNTKYSFVKGQPCTGDGVICAVLYTGVSTPDQHPDAFSSSFLSRIDAVFYGSDDIAISEENE